MRRNTPGVHGSQRCVVPRQQRQNDNGYDQGIAIKKHPPRDNNPAILLHCNAKQTAHHTACYTAIKIHNIGVRPRQLLVRGLP